MVYASLWKCLNIASFVLHPRLGIPNNIYWINVYSYTYYIHECMYCCVICEYIEKFCFAFRKYMYKCFSPVRLLFRCTAKEWSYFTFAQQWPLAVCTEVTHVREKKKDTFTL